MIIHCRLGKDDILNDFVYHILSSNHKCFRVSLPVLIEIIDFN